MKFLLSLFVLASSALADIYLNPGESIFIDNQRIACSGSSNPRVLIDTLSTQMDIRNSLKCDRARSYFNGARQARRQENIQAQCDSVTWGVSNFSIVARDLHPGSRVRLVIDRMEFSDASKFTRLINSLQSETLTARASAEKIPQSEYFRKVEIEITKY